MAHSVQLQSNRSWDDTIELVRGHPDNETVYLAADSEELFTPPTYEEVYVSSPATPGASRSRSRPENVTSTGKVWIQGTDSATMYAGISEWERTLSGIQERGGQLVYEPEDGPAVTYEVASGRLVTMPQRGIDLDLNRAESTFELTVKPYGRMAVTTLVANATGNVPLISFDVPAPDGSVDALPELKLTDTASQARNYVEWGFESEHYDPGAPWPLLVDSGSMTVLDSATASSTANAGYYGSGHLLQTAAVTSKGIASYTSSHIGRFVVKGRFFPVDASMAVRAAFSIRGAAPTFLPWKLITTQDDWYEVELGVAAIDPPADDSSHSVVWSVYCRSASGGPAISLDYLKLFPAELYGKSVGGVGAVAAIRSGRYWRVTDNVVESETATGVWTKHPNSPGAYLLIPPTGGRLAVAAGRTDFDSAAAYPAGAGLTDSLRADLSVTPRVLLLGA